MRHQGRFKIQQFAGTTKWFVEFRTYGYSFTEECIVPVVVQHGTDGKICDLGCPAGAGPAGHQTQPADPSRRHHKLAITQTVILLKLEKLHDRKSTQVVEVNNL